MEVCTDYAHFLFYSKYSKKKGKNIMSELVVPTTIIQQLGNQTIALLGAKQFAGDETSVKFRIGRNTKRITHIRITLTSLDLYKVEFFRMPRDLTKLTPETLKPVHTSEMIYDDMLHKCIETHTGLYTKF